MDSKGKMPHIKSDVNKLDDKKKSAGFLATLFGGGSSAGGLGGLGGGAAAGSGGMLATKAGMIGLLVIGSAVAGSVGMVGYKVFGPGQSDQVGGNLALFAPKPAGAQSDPNAAAPVNKDGSSASLDYMAQAAAKDKAADAAASASESVAAGSSASSADSSATGASGAINSGSGGKGALGSMGKALANAKKMGELSKGGSSGGATSVSASAAPIAAGQAGSVSAFKATGGRASASSGRAIASRMGSPNARNQLGSVSRDQRGAGSSMAAGTTYDGGAKGGSAIGPNGTAIGMDGTGSGGEAQPKSIAKNSAANVNEQSPPIPKPVHVVVPWEKAVQRAQMLVMIAIALAFAATMIPDGPYTKPILMALGGLISMIGVYVGVLAGQIMSGPYGQPLQGAVVAAAAIGVIATGVGVMLSPQANTKLKEVPQGTQGPPSPVGGSTNSLSGTGFMANPMVLIGGGLAAVSAIGLLLMPKPKPIEVPEGQRGPDVSYHQKAPPQNYEV